MRSLSDATMSQGEIWSQERLIAAGNSTTIFTVVAVVMIQMQLVNPDIYVRLLSEDKAIYSLQKAHGTTSTLL